MITFRADIKARTYNKDSNKWEFQWLGNLMRSETEQLQLFFEAEDEGQLQDKVIELSNNTVYIVGYMAVTADGIAEEEQVKQNIDLCKHPLTPSQFLRLLHTHGKDAITMN